MNRSKRAQRVAAGVLIAAALAACESPLIAPTTPPSALVVPIRCELTDPDCVGAPPPPPPSVTPNPKFGAVATGLGGTGMSPTEVRRILGFAKQAGISTLRHTVYWHQAQPDGPSFEPMYMAALDTFVKAATDSGIAPFLTPEATPLWARCPESGCTRATTTATPPHPDHILAWRAFMIGLLERYDGSHPSRPRVQYWGIWNEPNTEGFLDTYGYANWIDAYRPLFEWGVVTIRDHGRSVAGPELGWGASGRGLSPEAEFRNFVNTLGYWFRPQDIFTIHFYGAGSDLANRIPLLHSYAVNGQLGHIQMWVTEMSDGNPEVEGSDDFYQARTVTQLYQAALATSVPQWTKSFKYDLFWDTNMRLIRDATSTNPQPRPAYYCMKALARGSSLPSNCR